MNTFSNQPQLPRGERNNNPGNIRWNANITWLGQIGKDEDGYCIFDYVEHGIRAMAKDLSSKIRRGLNTIAKYIPVYAPRFENNTDGYIARTSQLSGIAADAVLSIDEPTLFRLVKAQISVEEGTSNAGLITDAMIAEGVGMAV